MLRPFLSDLPKRFCDLAVASPPRSLALFPARAGDRARHSSPDSSTSLTPARSHSSELTYPSIHPDSFALGFRPERIANERTDRQTDREGQANIRRKDGRKREPERERGRERERELVGRGMRAAPWQWMPQVGEGQQEQEQRQRQLRRATYKACPRTGANTRSTTSSVTCSRFR